MKIKVLSSKETITKDGKERTFYRYFTYVMIHVIDGNGEDLGEQKKSLEVIFTKDGSKSMLKVADKTIGSEPVFAVIDGDISLPFVYEIKVDENGNKEYPKVYVRSVEKYEPIPYTPRESTCKPILDENDTEPVEITE